MSNNLNTKHLSSSHILKKLSDDELKQVVGGMNTVEVIDGRLTIDAISGDSIEKNESQQFVHEREEKGLVSPSQPIQESW